MFKKADYILALLLILIGLTSSAYAVFGHSEGAKAVIYVDGREYGTYSLDKNQIITVDQNNHHNEITIKDGCISMSFSDCKNQVCVHTGSIHSTSQIITCLPNRILIRVEDDKEVQLDAVSN